MNDSALHHIHMLVVCMIQQTNLKKSSVSVK